MPVVSSNRKAFADYQIIEKFEAGLELLGSEVKSLRAGLLNLRDSFAVIRGEQAYLIGCYIGPYKQAGPMGHEPTRTRRMLMHKHEIQRLMGLIRQKGLTLIPLRIYFNARNRAKAELGLGKGRTHADRREVIKKREADREIRRALKSRNR